MAPMEGEEEDLVLDMLRSQQDGHFIIGGESVMGDAAMVSDFVAGEVGGRVEMGGGGGFADGSEESVPSSDAAGNGKASHAVPAEVRSGDGGEAVAICEKGTGEEIGNESKAPQVDKRTWTVGAAGDRGMGEAKFEEGERGKEEEGKIEEGVRRKEEEEGKIEEGERGVDEGMIEEGEQGKEEEGKIEEGERGVNEGRIEEVERGVEEGMVEEGERGVEEVKVAEREKGVQEGKVEECEGEVTEGKSEEGKPGVEEGKSEEAKAIEVEGVGGEAKALEAPVKMDMDVVSTCDGDDSGMKGGQEGDRGGGGDAIKKKEGGEEEVGSKLQSVVAANSEVPPPISSLPQVGKEVVGEDVGVELVVKHESRGVEMDGFEPPDADKTTDVMEKAGVVVQMDDAQLLDATMAAIGETCENKDISLSVLSTGVGGAAAEASQVVLNVNEELGSSGNASTRGPGRKKRGRQPKVQVPRVSKKKAEEDVCFICFDGGDLVVCDRRGCPKVYHPSCINRDEAFFKARGRWNCGWHICSICEKVAHHMCYTCTYSLCKGCIKQSKFFCIRGNKGLCETCKGMVMLIETNDPVNKTAAANFYDKNNWECLFKDYWMDVKQKLSLTFEEITKGKKSSKKAMARNEESSDEVYEAHEGASSSDSSSGRGSSTRKKAKRRQSVAPNEESSVTVADSEGSSFPGNNEWASKELLEFVSHMKDGETTVLSQFDVQALLLEYIKRNNLRDPRRKSQIICDSRLENLFGKTRVGHFEMLKLLESHFLMKETSNFAPDDDRMTNGEPDSNRADAEGSSEAVKMIADRRRKSRKKELKEPQTNFDDYAAIDVHNISLIYLRRNLMEEQLDDAENFNEKAVGSFVRIKIPATSPRQDTYRLVKVIGTTKAAEKYQAGKRMTEITLEILNLNKTEVISIDTISNQDFTEEECKRLRQSIKYGFIPRMTVGELQEKARNLQSIKVNDWLEVEKARLGHLRDRASETGRRKELRECVEKLELLPEEHARRLNDIPEVHSDSNMDPNYESAEEEPEDGRRDNMPWQRGHDYYRKGKETRAFEKDFTPTESWSGAKRGVVASLEQRNSSEMVMDSTDTMHNLSWGRGKDMPQHNNLESQNTRGTTSILQNIVQSSEEVGQLHSSVNASLSTPSSSTGAPSPRSPSINESDKMWCYQDPTGKIQGPFSMLQLRKWNSTGYFPRDLRIWKTSQRQDDSILLTDALIGKFVKELPAWGSRQGSVSLSPGSASMVDSRDKRDGWRGNNDFSKWTDKKFGVQEHGGTWTSGKPAAFQSNGSNHGRQTPTKGSSFQKFPSQEANVQNMASSFGSNSGLVPNNANRNSPATFGSSISGSARGNQPRVRVSRWEPEPGATFVHGQSGAEIPPKMDTSGVSGGAASTPLSMTSPMPKNEQFRNIASAVPGSNSNAPLAKNVGLSSQDKTNTEAIAGNSELPQINSFSEDMQKNYSPIRTEGNGAVHQVRGTAGGVKQSTSETIVSGPQPSSSGNWVASADAKNAEWSMPSPTPTSEVGRVGVGAQSSQRNNPPVFSDSSRHVPFSEMRPNSSVGSAPQPIQQQPQGPMGSQNSGWGFASENPAMNAMPTQAAGGWSAALPANANVAWVAPGASNVGWSAIPQGNANVVGWVPTAAGASIVNPVSQVAGPGTMNPVAGWGTVAQVPQANASWGTAVQQGNVNTGWGTPVQGFPNSNPGWVVPQPANADQNVGWGSQLPGNPNANVGWGTPNGNSNAGWNSPAGNQNSRGPHQREQKDRYNRNANNGDSGHGGGRHRTHSGGGSSRDPQGGSRGICRFHENGYCRRGAACNYLHT